MEKINWPEVEAAGEEIVTLCKQIIEREQVEVRSKVFDPNIDALIEQLNGVHAKRAILLNLDRSTVDRPLDSHVELNESISGGD